MRLQKTYSVEKIAKKAVLMPVGQGILDGSMLYSLNDTGEWYVKQLEQEISEAELLSRAYAWFEAETDKDRQQIASDLAHFLNELKEYGALQDDDPADQ